MKEVSLCDNCEREINTPDCGASVNDWEVKKGVGVTKCKLHIPKISRNS